MAVARLARIYALIFFTIYDTIRRCNARNTYNTVTTTLFTDVIWPNKVQNNKYN